MSATDSLMMDVATNPAYGHRAVVCLCGSTRFWEDFRDQGLRFTLEGVIVLSIDIAAPDSIVFAHATITDAIEQKRKLDELHFDKIDLADSIFVLNRDGYVGESTRNEIAYAILRGKPIAWLNPISGEALLSTDSHDFGRRVAQHRWRQQKRCLLRGTDG